MSTLPQALAELEQRRDELAGSLTAMGVPSDNTETLAALVPKVLEIDTGTGGGAGWQPPPDWPDIKSILQNDATQGYGGRYIQLITDHYDTTNFSTDAFAYRTSDGKFYTQNLVHTWDKTQDIPTGGGFKVRWMIYYTNPVNSIALESTCLWAVLDLTLSSVLTIANKRLLTAFEFINGKNLSGAVSNASSMFDGCYSLRKLSDGIDFSNITNAASMFSFCYALSRLPENLDFSKVSSANSMFNGCVSLYELPDGIIFSNIADAASMFNICYSLRSISKDIDLSQVVSSANNMFQNCYVLTGLPDILDFSNVISANNTFNNVSFIKRLRIYGLKVSLNISAGILIAGDDLLYTINNLQAASGQTLTIGAANLAKLTLQDIAIATNKGWTVA